jgi:outer membrane protein OmpA-like peptidoglycan-associated protein/tetratricopeptide (TPR) repeat protein
MKTIKFWPFLSLSFFLNVMIMGGQNVKDDLSDANRLYNSKRYSEALPYFLKSLESDPSNIDLNYKAGVCYWNSRSQKTNAILFLDKIISSNPSKNESAEIILSTYKLLGDVYHHAYQFDEAILCYEKCTQLIMELNSSQQECDEITAKLEMCRIGKALNGLSLSPEIKKEQNRKNSFFNSSSDVSEDQSTITFIFKREDQRIPVTEENRYFENEIQSRNNNAQVRERDSSKEKESNKFETTIATSIDGQIVLTYRDENGSAFLYTSNLKGNYWTTPEKLNRPVNPGGWETNECVSADGSTMFFTSDRKGGYGGSDIYICKKLENGEWGKAINLGPVINTPYDEEAPFIHPDGKTFYFSSNGYNKEKDFEIFNSIMSDNHVFSTPVKVGFPVDTTISKPLIEVPLVIPEMTVKSGKRKKTSPEQEDRKDNYIISFPNPNGVPLTLFKGTIIEKSDVKHSVKIIVRNNETAETVSTYLTETTNPAFSFVLPPSINNNISFQANGFLTQSENLDITDNKEYYKKRNPVELIPIEKDAKITLNNVFFDPGKSTIRSISKLELNDCIHLLNENSDLVIEVAGITECKSDVKENSRLCSERAEALVKYFNEKGIEMSRLNAKGYASKLKKSDPENINQRIEFRVIDGGKQWTAK